jgi:hypothetical protein
VVEPPREGLANADVGKCHRKTYVAGKCQNFLDHGLWLRLEHELSDEPEGNFFAVHVVMGARRGGKAIVNGVCSSKSRRLEPKTGKQSVSLDQTFKRIGGFLLMKCFDGGLPVCKERPVAKLCQGERDFVSAIEATAGSLLIAFGPAKVGAGTVASGCPEQNRRILRLSVGCNQPVVVNESSLDPLFWF